MEFWSFSFYSIARHIIFFGVKTFATRSAIFDMKNPFSIFEVKSFAN